jgi:3-hydroxyacyl-[acyl-carrier-protein] dehydratase
MTFTTLIHYPLNHPATEGHFEGRPIIPGVVILENVLSVIRSQNTLQGWQLNCDVYKLVSAKFMSPVLPGHQLEVGIVKVNTKINFECKRLPDLTVAAKGTFEFPVGDLVSVEFG